LDFFDLTKSKEHTGLQKLDTGESYHPLPDLKQGMIAEMAMHRAEMVD
jgi:hypothetical protein